MRFIHGNQSPGYGESNSTGLAGMPSALDIYFNLVVAESLGRNEWLFHKLDVTTPAKIFIQVLAVDFPFALPA